MSKKKMYRLLAFIIFSFGLLGIVLSAELKEYSREKVQSQATGAESGNKNDSAPTEDLKETAENTADSSTEDMINNTADNQAGQTTDETTTDTADIKEDLVLLFTGDIYLSDYVLNQYYKNGLSGILSKDIQSEFSAADITMVNEEFAFTSRGAKAKNKQYTFRVAPENVRVLQDMKVDIATLANNHTMDFGIEGLTDTLDTLKNAGIQYAGAGRTIDEAREIRYIKEKGRTIAYLGASRVIPVPDWNATSTKPGMLTTYDPTALTADIKTAKEQSDFVVVYVHWGIEKHDEPEEYQRSLAKQYIDAGADLVVGSHPHVLQGIEYYKGKPIIYSLGNFMFYSSIKQTALLKVTLDQENQPTVTMIPAKADNSCTYKIDDTGAVSEFYRYLTGISTGIQFDESGNVTPITE